MSRFTVFDTEDNSRELLESGQSGFLKKVTMVCALTDDGHSFFDRSSNCCEKFLEWILNSETGPIYAHNLQYDLGNLFGDCLDDFNLRMMPGSSRLLRATWKTKTFFDSMNLWPMALKKIGEAFGLVKLKMDVNSREYVLRDCEIVLKAISFVYDIVNEFDLGKVPSTIGGLAVRIWQTMSDNWFDDSELSRQAYYGGRVELFARSKPNIAYVDVNSLYPHGMLGLFPTSLDSRTDITGFGIAEATMQIPTTFVAPLPWRDDEGCNLYPVGKFRGVWTFAEIQNAVNQGGKILKLHQSFGSKDGFPYYRQFITEFYQRRLDSDSEAEKLFFKLLMNNLYGQLAMKGSLTVSANLVDSDFNSDGDYIGEETAYGCKKLTEASYPLREFCNCSHAAYVTSYGRLTLFDYLRQVPEDDLLYCDTDSVIFEKKGKLPFEISDGLGKMKLEGTAPLAIAYAPKAYSVRDFLKPGKKAESVYKAKGVKTISEDSKGVVTNHAKQFLESGKTEFSQPFKLREACAFFDRENARKLSVWRKVPRQFKNRYLRKDFDETEQRYWPKTIENQLTNSPRIG